ncbi:MAG: protein kinase [Deltaproteobacteria bacterium]|nr:protein kinase [Deltaproteobacteria bacterium]
MRVCAECGENLPEEVTHCPHDGVSLATPEERGNLAGVVLDDRYALEERIGSGGLGEVYRAHHVKMGKPFAIKVLHRNLIAQPQFVARFEREARALSRLHHPCCVSVTDFGHTAEGPYIVMELVEGRALASYTRKAGMPLAQAIDVMSHVLTGLKHAHAQGIVHRDLKPENVMLVPSPAVRAGLMPKILDFGLAAFRAGWASGGGTTALTSKGIVIGTPAYMAPEQVLLSGAAPVEATADLYSVGVMLYELCCGRRPFLGPTALDYLDQHRSEHPPPPRELRPTLPPALEVILLRALSKRPQDRYPSAEAFREALQAILPLPDELAEERPPRAGGAPPGTPSSVRPTEQRVPSSSSGARAEPSGVPSPHRGGVRAAWFPLGLVAVGVVLGGALYLHLRRPVQVARPGGVGTVAVAAPDAKVGEPDRGAPDGGLSDRGGTTDPARGGERARSTTTTPPRRTPRAPELASELVVGRRLWSQGAAGRRRAGKAFLSYLQAHPQDAAAHLFVGELFLRAQWAADGLRLVERGLRLAPERRLELDHLVAVAFALRPATQVRARAIFKRHEAKQVGQALLVAAAAIRDDRLRAALRQEAERRGRPRDEVSRRLWALSTARRCPERRAAVATLEAHAEHPAVQVLVSYLAAQPCVGKDARRVLARGARP